MEWIEIVQTDLGPSGDTMIELSNGMHLVVNDSVIQVNMVGKRPIVLELGTIPNSEATKPLGIIEIEWQEMK